MTTPKISTHTGEMNIIASGFGITFSKEADFVININFDKDFKFSVRFIFLDQEPYEKPDLRFSANLKSNIVTLTCINFNDTVGTGTTRPVNLATYRSKKIFLNFWVRTTNEKENREIKYCLYMEDNNA